MVSPEPRPVPGSWMREMPPQKGVKKMLFMNAIQEPLYSALKKKSKSLRAQIYVVIVEKNSFNCLESS